MVESTSGISWLGGCFVVADVPVGEETRSPLKARICVPAMIEVEATRSLYSFTMPSATSMPVIWWKSGWVVLVSFMAAKEAIPAPQA